MRHLTGKTGERIVYELLKGSEWNNEMQESRSGYDILWKKNKIEVKTTRYKLRNGFQTNLRSSQTGIKDVIFVVVALDDDKKYFWVIKDPKSCSTYLKLKDSISDKLLQKTILERRESGK